MKASITVFCKKFALKTAIPVYNVGQKIVVLEFIIWTNFFKIHRQSSRVDTSFLEQIAKLVSVFRVKCQDLKSNYKKQEDKDMCFILTFP